MKKLGCEIFRMPTNKGYKAVFSGRHNDHIMDWRGCNFRYMVIKGQPKKGYATADEAITFALNIPVETWESEIHRAHVVGGILHGAYYAQNDPEWIDTVHRDIYTKRLDIP